MLPQLDISFFPSQVFWLLVSFSLLFCVVNYSFLPKLEKTIYNRHKKAVSSFYHSFYLLRFAESIADKYNTALHQTKLQAKKMIDDTLLQVEEMRADFQVALEEEKVKMDKFVAEEITKFHAEHVNALKQMSMDLASIFYTKLTGHKADKKLVASLVAKEF